MSYSSDVLWVMAVEPRITPDQSSESWVCMKCNACARDGEHQFHVREKPVQKKQQQKDKCLKQPYSACHKTDWVNNFRTYYERASSWSMEHLKAPIISQKHFKHSCNVPKTCSNLYISHQLRAVFMLQVLDGCYFIELILLMTLSK